MAYIGSGSIEVQGSRVEFKKDLFISGTLGSNQGADAVGPDYIIALSGGDGGPAIGTVTTILGVDHPWRSYMELNCDRLSTNAAAGGFNAIRIGPGDHPGQIVTMVITDGASGSGDFGSEKINLILSGSPGSAATGYAGLWADGIAPAITGKGNGGLGHVGAAWQMIWNGTFWVLTMQNGHVTNADLG